MKQIILITFIFYLFINLAYSQKTNSNLHCNIKISKKEFLKHHLDLKCNELDTSIITSYKLKLRGHKTVSLEGNTLNSNAVNTIKRAKVEDFIIIFDIKFKPKGDYIQNYDIEENSKRRIKTISVQIIK